MAEAVIVEAVRTPIGTAGGSLASVRPDDLAGLVLKTVLQRSGLDPALVDEVYLGCTNQAGEDSRNVGRMAALLAGLPVEVPAVTVNRLCASGLTAVNLAARAIHAGDGDIYLAGGVESMSRAPYSLPKADKAFGYGNLTAWDTALGWRYPNPRLQELYGSDSMGETAENIAEMTGITRQEQDAYTLESHRRAVAAMDAGRFMGEIVPVAVPQPGGEPRLVTVDERPRRDSNMEALAKLKPAFRKDGSVTAANASGINDGAAALLVMSSERARQLGMRPLARISGYAAAGLPPRIMGLGPVPAVRKLLPRSGVTLDQIDLFEINEAFAVQVLAVMKELGLAHEKVNVNGGAIALGHPLGCSGARILTTLVHEMRRRAPGARRPFYGLASLCVGVGQGEAALIEWLDED